MEGVIAQLVEQRTENPCVPGSIPGDTTENKTQVIDYQLLGFYFCLQLLKIEGILKATSKGSTEIFGAYVKIYK